jgi:hypothetical protein
MQLPTTATIYVINNQKEVMMLRIYKMVFSIIALMLFSLNVVFAETGQLCWLGEINQDYARFGHIVNTAGDVNGDTYDDVIIQAFYYDNGQTDEGGAFVYYGSADGLSQIPDWSGEGNQNHARYGNGACTAGDVNNDGYDDVIVGAHGYDHGQADEGCAYLYYGDSVGLSQTADWFAEGNMSWGLFGHGCCNAGDVNGDSYDDVIIGSPHENNNGRVFVYYGSANGLSNNNYWLKTDPNSNRFGWSVSAAGDVNGDNYDDVIIGASAQLPYVPYRPGRAYVYYGSPSGLADSADWVVVSDQIGEDFAYNVSTAGDVNNDGYDDVIVGSRRHSNGENYEGCAYVYYGSASGLSDTANWIAEGNQVGAEFGLYVSDAGDVNNDGYDDVIIGAPYYDNGEIDEGRIYVYLGGPLGLAATPALIIEANQVGATMGFGVAAAGDVDNDGYAEIIFGAPLYDNGESNEGVAFVYKLVQPMVQATIDIDPNTLNLKSNGKWVTCYIELPAGYDVEDIDKASVALTSINDSVIEPPLFRTGPTGIGDYDWDSIPDLMVKFDRQTLIEELELIIVPPVDIRLTIKGTLIDETQFEGTDVIHVIRPGSNNQNAGSNTSSSGCYISNVWPNPCISTAFINCMLNEDTYVDLKIYDVNGRLIKVLVGDYMEADEYELCWDGKDTRGNDVKNGVYFCKMTAGGVTSTKKLLILK